MPTLSDLGLNAGTGEHRVRCPECDGRKKTLGVDTDQGVFHCFRCGWKGRLGDEGGQWYDKHLPEPPTEKKQQTQSDVAATASKRWDRAALVASHPYLDAKRLKPIGLRVEGEALLVPMRDSRHRVWNLQRIFADGKKLFLKGGRVKSLFFEIRGEPDLPIFICEGIATGLALNQSIEKGAHVFCAFSTGNLEAVAEAVRYNHPRREIVVACDNDQFTDGNPGLTYGRKVADAIGAKVFYPRFDADELDMRPTDFADMHLILEAQKNG